MELTDAEREVATAISEATAVVPIGAGTHREVGGPVPRGTEVRAPVGVVAYDPAELTITVGAGTTVAELSSKLAESGQECPLDPASTDATVGGTLATGLSGPRRLRYGPLRDRVLEVRFVTGDGVVVRCGGPTVKNVTGYDLPRLLVGSLGTIGVITRVILRCQPRPLHAQWLRGTGDPDDLRVRCFRPSSALWDGESAWILLEGHPDDLDAQARSAGLDPIANGPTWPSGPHRGRASVLPTRVREVCAELAHVDDASWLAEAGVGTVHVAAATEDALADARAIVESSGGWLLREAGAPNLDGFGVQLPNAPLMLRVKQAFDPAGKLSPGRIPFPTVGREEAVAS
jgi:glycolate oxidase FAD binding subunit